MKKYLTAFLGLILLSSIAYAAVTRTQFLNNQRTKFAEEVVELQTAKDASLANQGRIDRINYGLPILEALIAEVQDGELRGDWMRIHDEYSAEAMSWEADIESWNRRIQKAQDKVDEIDRLLAE